MRKRKAADDGVLIFETIASEGVFKTRINMKLLHACIFLAVCFLALEFADCNIHRAVHTRRRPKQESGFLARFYTKLKKSWLAIPASFVVGCTGIFPLLVIPVQAGKSLKEGSKFEYILVESNFLRNFTVFTRHLRFTSRVIHIH